MTDIRIEGAKIIIVGGSSGMGLALARRLLGEGAAVTIAGRSEDRLAAACRHLGEHPGLATITVDISREEEVAALFRNSGPLDHIVSTAADIEGAYQLPRGPMMELTNSSGPEPEQERTMPDDKRRLREEKRIIKRAGQKHARRETKRALRDDPANAHDLGMDYGRWSTDKRK
jgi:NAD(P)-dependent dehydrogenase (short-subunit alcohol dehydrogenase family)